MAAADFPGRWPELLPTLAQALAAAAVPGQASSGGAGFNTEEEPGTPTIGGRGCSSPAAAAVAAPLEQVLVAVATVAKQFVWFRDPSDKAAGVSARPEGAAPAELDAFVGARD